MAGIFWAKLAREVSQRGAAAAHFLLSLGPLALFPHLMHQGPTEGPWQCHASRRERQAKEDATSYYERLAPAWLQKTVSETRSYARPSPA